MTDVQPTLAAIEMAIRLAYGAGAIDGHEFAHGRGQRPDIETYVSQAMANLLY